MLSFILQNNLNIKDKLRVMYDTRPNSYQKVYHTIDLSGIFIFREDKLIVCYPKLSETSFQNRHTFIYRDKPLEVFVEDKIVSTYSDYQKYNN